MEPPSSSSSSHHHHLSSSSSSSHQFPMNPKRVRERLDHLLTTTFSKIDELQALLKAEGKVTGKEASQSTLAPVLARQNAIMRRIEGIMANAGVPIAGPSSSGSSGDQQTTIKGSSHSPATANTSMPHSNLDVSYKDSSRRGSGSKERSHFHHSDGSSSVDRRSRRSHNRHRNPLKADETYHGPFVVGLPPVSLSQHNLTQHSLAQQPQKYYEEPPIPASGNQTMMGGSLQFAPPRESLSQTNLYTQDQFDDSALSDAIGNLTTSSLSSSNLPDRNFNVRNETTKPFMMDDYFKYSQKHKGVMNPSLESWAKQREMVLARKDDVLNTLKRHVEACDKKNFNYDEENNVQTTPALPPRLPRKQKMEGFKGQLGLEYNNETEDGAAWVQDLPTIV